MPNAYPIRASSDLGGDLAKQEREVFSAGRVLRIRCPCVTLLLYNSLNKNILNTKLGPGLCGFSQRSISNSSTFPTMASVSEKNIFQNILKLASGEGIGRIIGFAVAPIITRIYSPSDLGILAVYSSLLALIAPFSTLRYTLAIPICRTEKHAVNLMVVCFLILIFGTAIMNLVFCMFGAPLLNLLNMEVLQSYWYLLPIGFLFTGAFDILSQYAVRKKDMISLAKASVIQKIIGSAFKIVLGLLSIKPIGLLLGDLLNQSGGITILLRSFWSDIQSRYKYLSSVKFCYLVRRYKNFPIYRVPSQILLAASSSLPIMYFAYQFDAETTGQIGIARTMLSVPVTFLGYAVGKAYFAEIASMRRVSGDVFSLTVSVVKKLFLLSIVPFGVIVLFGPLIFEIIFGSEWHDSGLYARLFSVYLIFQFMYSPISDGIFNVFEKQSKVFALEMFRFSIIISTLFISFVFQFKPSTTILFYSSGLAIQYIISLIVVLYIVKYSQHEAA